MISAWWLVPSVAALAGLWYGYRVASEEAEFTDRLNAMDDAMLDLWRESDGDLTSLSWEGDEYG